MWYLEHASGAFDNLIVAERPQGASVANGFAEAVGVWDVAPQCLPGTPTQVCTCQRQVSHTVDGLLGVLVYLPEGEDVSERRQVGAVERIGAALQHVQLV